MSAGVLLPRLACCVVSIVTVACGVCLCASNWPKSTCAHLLLCTYNVNKVVCCSVPTVCNLVMSDEHTAHRQLKADILLWHYVSWLVTLPCASGLGTVCIVSWINWSLFEPVEFCAMWKNCAMLYLILHPILPIRCSVFNVEALESPSTCQNVYILTKHFVSKWIINVLQYIAYYFTKNIIRCSRMLIILHFICKQNQFCGSCSTMPILLTRSWEFRGRCRNLFNDIAAVGDQWISWIFSIKILNRCK